MIIPNAQALFHQDNRTPSSFHFLNDSEGFARLQSLPETSPINLFYLSFLSHFIESACRIILSNPTDNSSHSYEFVSNGVSIQTEKGDFDSFIRELAPKFNNGSDASLENVLLKLIKAKDTNTLLSLCQNPLTAYYLLSQAKFCRYLKKHDTLIEAAVNTVFPYFDALESVLNKINMRMPWIEKKLFDYSGAWDFGRSLKFRDSLRKSYIKLIGKMTPEDKISFLDSFKNEPLSTVEPVFSLALYDFNVSLSDFPKIHYSSVVDAVVNNQETVAFIRERLPTSALDEIDNRLSSVIATATGEPLVNAVYALKKITERSLEYHFRLSNQALFGRTDYILGAGSKNDGIEFCGHYISKHFAPLLLGITHRHEGLTPESLINILPFLARRVSSSVNCYEQYDSSAWPYNNPFFALTSEGHKGSSHKLEYGKHSDLAMTIDAMDAPIEDRKSLMLLLSAASYFECKQRPVDEGLLPHPLFADVDCNDIILRNKVLALESMSSEAKLLNLLHWASACDIDARNPAESFAINPASLLIKDESIERYAFNLLRVFESIQAPNLLSGRSLSLEMFLVAVMLKADVLKPDISPDRNAMMSQIISQYTRVTGGEYSPIIEAHCCSIGKLEWLATGDPSYVAQTNRTLDKIKSDYSGAYYDKLRGVIPFGNFHQVFMMPMISKLTQSCNASYIYKDPTSEMMAYLLNTHDKLLSTDANAYDFLYKNGKLDDGVMTDDWYQSLEEKYFPKAKCCHHFIKAHCIHSQRVIDSFIEKTLAGEAAVALNQQRSLAFSL